MPAITDSKYLTNCGWDDAPHLTAERKAKMLAETPPYLRDARSKGLPSLGRGAVYPISQDEIFIDPFVIPPHFTRGYGMDVGWNRTACVWTAHDRETDVLYLISEHYRGQAEPSVHASAIKARGQWQPGFIDPAAQGRSQKDGEQLLINYRDLGLRLFIADNGVESGVLDVYERLSTGRMKVFNTLVNWRAEYGIYRRDDHGRIVKKNDHLMDATRYASRPSSIMLMTTKPQAALLSTKPQGVGDSRVGY